MKPTFTLIVLVLMVGKVFGQDIGAKNQFGLVSESATLLDLNGLIFEYEYEYYYSSDTLLTEESEVIIKIEIRNNFQREINKLGYSFDDVYKNHRDSVETHLASLNSDMTINKVKISTVEIKYLLVPRRIFDALVEVSKYKKIDLDRIKPLE